MAADALTSATGEALVPRGLALLIGGGMFMTPKFAAGEAHFHSCPECYEDEACELPCSHHLDTDVTMRGSHATCGACEATG